MSDQKIDKLAQVLEKLKTRTEAQKELKMQHNIDLEVLLNPEHAQFKEKYHLRDEELDHKHMLVRVKNAQRTAGILGSFATYHAVKYVLWNRGIGAHLFYRTRLLSIPVLLSGLWYSTCRAYPRDLTASGILEYTKRRAYFERDMSKLKKFMQLRQDFFTENSREQTAAV